MKKLLVIVTALCLLCACLLLGGCGGPKTKTINLNKYVVWSDAKSGKYNGQGSMKASFDEEAFKKDYTGKFKLTEEGKALSTWYTGMSTTDMFLEIADISCSAHENYGLCNGDEVHINWHVHDEEVLLEYFNVKLEYGDEPKIVEGLKDIGVKLTYDDCVVIGKQGDEPMEWRILKWNDDKMLVFFDDIGVRKYNEKLEKVTWDSCDLRKWLNNDFINKTFTEEEQKLILTTTVKSAGNSKYGTDGGKNTEDRLFLLSLEELNTYKDKMDGFWGNCRYWLRNPGKDTRYAATYGTMTNYLKGSFVEEDLLGSFVDGSIGKDENIRHDSDGKTYVDRRDLADWASHQFVEEGGARIMAAMWLDIAK